jgi:ABC-type phosphate transport system substrate-binding protein
MARLRSSPFLLTLCFEGSVVRVPKYILRGVLVLALAAMPVMADVVPVVSAGSAVTALSKEQITDIFLGKMTRFPNGSPAVPIDQTEGEVVRDEFYAIVLGKSVEQMATYWSKIIFTGRGQPPRTVANSLAMKKLIVGNPSAIGYMDPKLLDDTVRVVTVTAK